MSVPDYSKLSNWIDSATERGAVAVITHKNGDMDTIGSALVIAKAIGPKARACGTNIGSLAKRMLSDMDYGFHILDPNRPVLPRSLGGIIVVDSASPGQIGFELPDSVPVCVIDHHTSASEEWSKDALIFKADASSTAEMVWEWMKIRTVELNSSSATLLLAAIISDTGRFKHARPGCYRRVEEISEASGVDPVDVIEKMESKDLNYSQRMGILKAVSHSNSQDVAGIIVATTKASTHEGVVAHALIGAGAHVAFVQKKIPEGMRITGRASRTATNQGVNLGVVMSNLVSKLGGEGGGHPGAAGWSGEVHPVELESSVLAALSTELMN
ncbi:MAG: hypothetical protein CND29_01180 [Marine Group II euryarchaeote MED-G36]|jgi:nanoRNase/pAp phosphatase (c-di-AMP/oligoRNAs hydrolase)|nr:MAG: hypothetical protein CND29_01180 [Marine Group II euryarchaeote MED-G36]